MKIFVYVDYTIEVEIPDAANVDDDQLEIALKHAFQEERDGRRLLAAEIAEQGAVDATRKAVTWAIGAALRVLAKPGNSKRASRARQRLEGVYDRAVRCWAAGGDQVHGGSNPRVDFDYEE